MSPLLSSSIFIKIHASHIKSNYKIDITNLIRGHIRYGHFNWRHSVCCDTWWRFGSTLLNRKLVSNGIEEYLNHVIHIILPISSEENWTFSVLIGSIFTTNLKLKLNSCVHYFSIKSCVHICHARDKNIETITVGFTGLKKLHKYILNGLNSQWNDRMTSLPVNFRFYRMLKISFSKIFIAPKGRFLTFDPM